MKIVEKFLGILIFEIIIFWIFVRYFYLPKIYSNPNFFAFENLIILVIILNIITFGILYFKGKSEFKIVFLINIFLAPLILFLVYNKANEKFLEKNYAGGKFRYENNEYSIFIDLKKENFLITKTDLKTNKTNIIGGKTEILNDKIILKTKTEKYFVENDSIKGIEGRNFKIK